MKRLLIAILIILIVPWQVSTGVQVVAAACASCSLTISPSSVTPPGQITVGGSGFAAVTNITLSVNIQGVNSQTLTTDGSGNLPLTTFNIPQGTPPGTYTVTAYSGATYLTQKTFTVTGPQVTVSPNPANPGDSITVSGTAFAPNTSVTVHITFTLSDGTNVIAQEQDNVASDGTFSTTTLMVPSSTVGGNYVVHVSQNVSSSTDIAHTTLTVTGSGLTGTPTPTATTTTTPTTASITLNPTTATLGSTVTVTGTGFGANETVQASYTANLAAGGSTNQVATGTSDSNGNVTISMVVPRAIQAGTYTVTATGSTSHRTATAQLTVQNQAQATVTVSPTTVSPGGTITVSGQGFTPNTTVTIGLQEPSTGGQTITINSTATTDSSGNFQQSVTVPSNSPTGTATVTASQTQNGATISGSATLTIAASNASIQVSPATASPGDTVTVTGTGFAPGPGNQVTVSVSMIVNGTQQTVSATTDTDSSGSWSASLTIPSGAQPATYNVTATQATGGAHATTTLQVQGAAVSTATPTPTQTPVETPTQTPTETPVGPTPTDTPVPTPTKTKTPSQPSSSALHFQSLSLWYHIVRIGTFNHIEMQATPHRRVGIWAHVIFPTGLHFDWYEQTTASGHWSKQFDVPADTISRYSNRGHVELQLWMGKKSVKDFLPFTIVS